MLNHSEEIDSYRKVMPKRSVSPSPRVVIVDDTDPGIRYNGTGWVSFQNSTLAPPTADSPLGTEMPFQGTLHELHGVGSMEYSFTGVNAVAVWGRTPSPNFNFTCSVDGKISNVTISTDLRWETGNSGQPICIVELPTESSPHSLVVQVGQVDGTFWVDSITFIPPPDAVPDNAVIMVQTTDSGIQFGKDWQFTNATLVGVTDASTEAAGTSAKFIFNGRAITVIGHSTPPKLPQGSYSIDGGENISFTIPDAFTSGNFPVAIPYFTTPVLRWASVARFRR